MKISKEQFKTLPDNLKEYFEREANGGDNEKGMSLNNTHPT